MTPFTTFFIAMLCVSMALGLIGLIKGLCYVMYEFLELKARAKRRSKACP